MLTDRGAVILDLGVLRDITSDSVISGDKFLGTIRYAAPEYLFGESITQACDTYSFGAILYELSVGKPLLDPDLYWSKQILEKSNTQSHEWRESVPYREWYKRLGFKKARFLNDTLKATLGDHVERPSGRQLRDAFKRKVWNDTLACPYEKGSWPFVPADLRVRAHSVLSHLHSQDLRILRKWIRPAHLTSQDYIEIEDTRIDADDYIDIQGSYTGLNERLLSDLSEHLGVLENLEMVEPEGQSPGYKLYWRAWLSPLGWQVIQVADIV